MSALSKKIGPLGQKEIREFIPHREPFLFVDTILEIVPGLDEDGNPTPVGTIVRGVKKFLLEESFFRGHFPNYPITPGVIITESAGQIGTFAFYPFTPRLLGADGEPLKLAGVNQARFRKPVLPNDEIEAQIKVLKNRKSLWFFEVLVTVNREKIADLELLANFDLKMDR